MSNMCWRKIRKWSAPSHESNYSVVEVYFPRTVIHSCLYIQACMDELYSSFLITIMYHTYIHIRIGFESRSYGQGKPEVSM